MMSWCLANCGDERKDGESDSQFLYKTRKKALGPFKRQLWTLPADAQEQIGANLRHRFGILFDELNVGGTRELVDRYVAPPDAATSAAAGAGRRCAHRRLGGRGRLRGRRLGGVGADP